MGRNENATPNCNSFNFPFHPVRLQNARHLQEECNMIQALKSTSYPYRDKLERQTTHSKIIELDEQIRF